MTGLLRPTHPESSHVRPRLRRQVPRSTYRILPAPELESIWCHGHCSIGRGGRETQRRHGLAHESVSQHGASESFERGGDS